MALLVILGQLVLPVIAGQTVRLPVQLGIQAIRGTPEILVPLAIPALPQP